VLGDNRDNSQDSRVASHGYVPFENLIGRVGTIFWSVTPNAPAGASPVRFERIGMRVR
jgi:signal peptidase I